jgi:hypothetical protein
MSFDDENHFEYALGFAVVGAAVGRSSEGDPGASL